LVAKNWSLNNFFLVVASLSAISYHPHATTQPDASFLIFLTNNLESESEA